MAPYDRGIISINGHKWKDVTNQTCSGPVYPLRDVVACGGRVPNFASGTFTKKAEPERSREMDKKDLLGENAQRQEQPVSFGKKLCDLINCYSLENGSDTPDFILAQYLNDCLQAYNKAVTLRSDWLTQEEKTNERV